MRSASATITLPCEPHERGWRGQRLTATQVVYTCHVYRDREPILQASYLTAARETANTALTAALEKELDR